MGLCGSIAWLLAVAAAATFNVVSVSGAALVLKSDALIPKTLPFVTLPQLDDGDHQQDEDEAVGSGGLADIEDFWDTRRFLQFPPTNHFPKDKSRARKPLEQQSGSDSRSGVGVAAPSCGLLPGSMYLSEMRIPVIGKQVFQLWITSPTTARLSIQGRILRLNDDSIEFRVDQTSGDISFVVSGATQALLRRFRTRLGRVVYNPGQDEASLEVRPPLPTAIRLQFKRVWA